MQPRFPADHHFHRHRAHADAPHPAPDLAAPTERVAGYLQRQCMPAGDPSDPRRQPS
jgi:hypothetical protein